MSKQQYILAIDQGTSSTKSLIFDDKGKMIAKGSENLFTHYLDDGFVEQEPEIIYQNVLASVSKCLQDFTSKGYDKKDIVAIGISNQRETFVVWDKDGKPLHNAVVWQCKRSVQVCEDLKEKGLSKMVQEKTGLIIDPYFSATKLIWLAANNTAIKEAIQTKTACFGTIDTWLLYKLTQGKVFATDYTNASRTLLFNLHELKWDAELIDELGLTGINLPEIKASAASFGETDLGGLLPAPVPVTAMIGDSHAAAFGEGCFTPGTAKATLGTGCSILMNIGKETKSSNNGMVTTICWSTEDTVQYALEGVIVSCGATIEWLKNQLELFADSSATERMATSIPDNGGVYLIPAFSGLGAPHWDMNRKASIIGLSFGTKKNHMVRAALESIPYQVKDVIVAMESDTGIALQQLMVDGGISTNQFVVQFLSDLLDKAVVNIGQQDVSALGAAYMAGLKAGVYQGLSHLASLNNDKKLYSPTPGNKTSLYYEGWKRVVSSAF